MMDQIGNLKTTGRIVSLALLLATMMGPWFIDTHPATADTCSPPLVWLDNGYCACLVTFIAAFRLSFSPGHHMLWLLFLPLALPFLSTLLLLPDWQHRRLRAFHLTAWGILALYALLMFVGRWYSNPKLIIWGAGFGVAVAAVVLVGEIQAGRINKAGFQPQK